LDAAQTARRAMSVSDQARMDEITGIVGDAYPPVVAAETLATTTTLHPHPVATADDAAYVQYTSGTTGRSEPVVPRHRNVLAQLRLSAQVYQESVESVSVHW